MLSSEHCINPWTSLDQFPIFTPRKESNKSIFLLLDNGTILN
jgi:hypothetical protein